MGDEPPDRAGDASRDFDRRLREAEDRARQRTAEEPSDRHRAEGMAVGLRIAVELAAAVAIGTAIGYGLDRWFETAPLFLVIFFIVGCAAGFLNVYRTAQELDRQRDRARRTDGNGPS
jgi:ATP synthase protein I